MEILNLLNRLEESKEFKEWKKNNKNSFLAHIFKMLDDANKDDWQVGYYNKDDTITTFVITQNDVKKAETENIFKRPDAKIKKLEKEKIKIDAAYALQTAEKTQTNEYREEIPFKIILLLQRLDIGQVYNITYITRGFKILNFKISSIDGKVLEKSLKPVMEFR